MTSESDYEENDILTVDDLQSNKAALYRNSRKLHKYTRYYYKLINFELRAKKDISRFTLNLIDGILEVLTESSPIERGYFVYRGIDFDPFKNGDIFYDPGFTSKTLSFKIATNFSLDDGVILEIHYPTASKQIYLEPISELGYEKEVLSYPGEKLKRIGEKRISGHRVIVCKMLGSFFDRQNITVNPRIDISIETRITPFLETVFQHREISFWIEYNDKLRGYTIQNEKRPISPNFKRLKPWEVYDFLFLNIRLGNIRKLLLPRSQRRIDQKDCIVYEY